MSILIVEDNPEDFEACVYALRKHINEPIVHCSDGDEALKYLTHFKTMNAKTKEASLPSLIFLDLNLPSMDGRLVLSAIKSDAQLRKIPIVILTTSNTPQDVDFCYLNGANSYLVKPVNLSQFVTSVGDVVRYWFSTVVLPVYREKWA
jgi:two-component system, response regulator